MPPHFKQNDRLSQKKANMKTILLLITALCAVSTSTVLFWQPYSPAPPPPAPPQQLNASVMLSKWQVHKMLNSFDEDDHMAEMRVFHSVVKNSADGWRISSTHLVRNDYENKER